MNRSGGVISQSVTVAVVEAPLICLNITLLRNGQQNALLLLHFLIVLGYPQLQRHIRSRLRVLQLIIIAIDHRQQAV